MPYSTNGWPHLHRVLGPIGDFPISIGFSFVSALVLTCEIYTTNRKGDINKLRHETKEKGGEIIFILSGSKRNKKWTMRVNRVQIGMTSFMRCPKTVYLKYTDTDDP